MMSSKSDPQKLHRNPSLRRKKPVLVLDFNNSMMRIMVLSSGQRGLVLRDFARTPIANGNPDACVKFILEFMKRHDLGHMEAVVTVSEPDAVFLKPLNIQALPAAETLEAIRWQVKDEMPFEFQGASVDWNVLKESKGEDGIKQQSLLFLALKKEEMDRCIVILKRCQLNPQKISVASFNYEYLLKTSPSSGVAPVAVLDIDDKHAFLNIYISQKLNFVRRLPVSWEKLTSSLMAPLVSDRGKVQLTSEEAEEIKSTIGIPDEETAGPEGRIQGNQIIALIRPILESLIREVKFSLTYFATQYNAEKLEGLYLTGGGSNLKNLDHYLTRELGIPVSLLPAHPKLEVPPAISSRWDKEVTVFANLVGAVFSDVHSIDLLPADVKNQRRIEWAKVMFRISAFSFILIFLALYMAKDFQARDYQKRLATARLHLQAIESIRTLQTHIDLREGLREKLQRGIVPVEGVLKTVSSLIPPQIVLEELTFEQDRGHLKLAGAVQSSGEDPDTILINFVEKLENSDFLASVILTSSQQENDVQKFEINCDLSSER